MPVFLEISVTPIHLWVWPKSWCWSTRWLFSSQLLLSWIYNLCCFLEVCPWPTSHHHTLYTIQLWSIMCQYAHCNSRYGSNLGVSKLPMRSINGMSSACARCPTAFSSEVLRHRDGWRIEASNWFPKSMDLFWMEFEGCQEKKDPENQWSSFPTYRKDDERCNDQWKPWCCGKIIHQADLEVRPYSLPRLIQMSRKQSEIWFLPSQHTRIL